MKRLTTNQLRRSARAARELASEYAEGRGPKLVNHNWCGCAAGQVVKRARLPKWFADPERPWMMTAEWLDCEGHFLPFMMLSDATSSQCRAATPEPGAVVFPLLALADACDETAVNAPTGALRESYGK